MTMMMCMNMTIIIDNHRDRHMDIGGLFLLKLVKYYNVLYMVYVIRYEC